MDIATGLSAASNGLSIAAWLKKVGKDYDAAEYKMKIAELVDALTDAKLALSEAKEATAAQSKEIEALKVNFQTKGLLARGAGDYLYFAGPEGSPLGFPICPSCEADGLIMQLKQDGSPDKAKCPKCKESFQPVSCYLPSGSQDATLHDQQSRLQRERNNRSFEAFGRINRGVV